MDIICFGAFRQPPRWARSALLFLLRARALDADALLHAHAAAGGRLLVTANHVSFLDGVLIALTSPIPMHYAVEREYAVRNRATSAVLAFLAWLGCGAVVPLDAQAPHGLRTLLRLLDQTSPVMLFPEGRIGTGEPQAVMPGLAWLLKKSGATEFRIQIAGAEQSRLFAKAGSKWWPPITIEFGVARAPRTPEGERPPYQLQALPRPSAPPSRGRITVS